MKKNQVVVSTISPRHRARMEERDQTRSDVSLGYREPERSPAPCLHHNPQASGHVLTIKLPVDDVL